MPRASSHCGGGASAERRAGRGGGEVGVGGVGRCGKARDGDGLAHRRGAHHEGLGDHVADAAVADGGERRDEADEGDAARLPVDQPEQPADERPSEPAGAAVGAHGAQAGEQLAHREAGEALQDHQAQDADGEPRAAEGPADRLVTEVGGVLEGDARAALLVHVGIAELGGGRPRAQLEVLHLRGGQHRGRHGDQQEVQDGGEHPPPEHGGGVGAGRLGHPPVSTTAPGARPGDRRRDGDR